MPLPDDSRCYNAVLASRKHTQRYILKVDSTVHYGLENLRRYLEEAKLPTISRHNRSSQYCLPLKGRRTHKNKLKVRHEATRRLTKIRHYDIKAFDEAVLAYQKNRIYGHKGRPFAGKHYRRRRNEALVLPARFYQPEEKFADIRYPCNIEETCRWVVERPLRTMQRAMHVAFPDTTRWWVDEVDAESVPNRDSALWRTYVWRFHPDDNHDTWWRDVRESASGVETKAAPCEAMVVAVQAPWILGPQDMENVSECTYLPGWEDGVPPEGPLTSEQRVWAKLYDTCHALKCHAFALTTYHGWMFGEFSEDWTSVHASEVKEFDAKRPNVMQSLVYWVAASMDLPGAKDQSSIPVLPC